MPYKQPDMIERLRECPSQRELKHGIDAETTGIWHRLCCDAADEIDRLTAELAEAKKDSARLDWMLWNLDSLPTLPHFSDAQYVDLCRAAIDDAREA